MSDNTPYQRIQTQRANEVGQTSQERHSRTLKQLGAQIKAARTTWHMSQSHLAYLAGTTQATIANIEAGRGNPTLLTLQAITATLPGLSLQVALRRTPVL